MDIEKLSTLARIELTKAEKKELQKDLSSILDFVSKLKSAPIENIKGTGHAFDDFNIFREDLPSREKTELPAKLVEAAPSRQKDYFKVKPILESNEN